MSPRCAAPQKELPRLMGIRPRLASARRIGPVQAKLGVEVAIAAFVGDLDGRLIRVLHEGLVFDGGKVLALGVVAERSDGFALRGPGGRFGFGRHGQMRSAECGVRDEPATSPWPPKAEREWDGWEEPDMGR